jgi:Ca2+-binding RTX toxin-like protein
LNNGAYYTGKAADALQPLPGNAGTDTVISSVSHTLANGVENLTLASGAGPIGGTGNGLANVIIGNQSNNSLSGLAGNDYLDGGAGADAMAGGAGNDTYVVDNAGDVVTEGGFAIPSGWTVKGTADFNNDGELDVVVSSASANQIWLLNNEAVSSVTSLPNASMSGWQSWTLTGVADLNNDGRKDVLYTHISDGRQWGEHLNGATLLNNGAYYSGKAVDALQPLPGNAGTDTVVSSVSHTLANGVENLTLANGAGSINGTGNGLANVIIGNEGNNLISGLAGADALTGNGGADTFVFASPSGGIDTITDFVSGLDSLQISASGFGGGLSAGGAVTLIAALSAAAAVNAGLGGYFIFDNSGADAGTVLWDATGGSGADAVAIAKLQTGAILQHSDFQIA